MVRVISLSSQGDTLLTLLCAERETIFIVGTLEDKGRCSSHPPRTFKSPKNTPSPPSTPSAVATTRLNTARPLRSAWDDTINISDSGMNQQLRVVALHTPLNATIRRHSASSSANQISLPPYTPVDIQPRFQNEDFWLSSKCQVHLSSSHEGMLLYLYEHNASHAYTAPVYWDDTVTQFQNNIKRSGPGRFAIFPAHHFFARVYRPADIATALLNRKSTFCGDPDWLSAPWERHPKSLFDRLLDIVSQIPALLQRLDQLLALEPTVTRCLMAKDLLDNCLAVREALERWHFNLYHTLYRSRPPYWISSNQAALQMPFAHTFDFADQLTSLTFLYYWAVQVLFYPCLGLLHHLIFSPAIDEVSHMQIFPEGPPHLNIDFEAFGPSKAREIASNVCKGLDAALAVSMQPDLLAFPVHVVDTLYKGMNVVTQDGEGTLELLWLDGFRSRMMLRGQSLAATVMERDFTDLAEW